MQSSAIYRKRHGLVVILPRLRFDLTGVSLSEILEIRLLPAAVQPTAQEQYMIELINRARANPLAEAARYGLPDLNEGISPAQITSNAKQPLAVNPFITDAARTFARVMREGNFLSHDGPGGSTPASRLASSGYAQPPGTAISENAGYVVTSYADKAERLHRAFFLDYTNAFGGRGHRIQMLDPNMTEVGAGFSQGSWTYNGTTHANAFLGVVNFAAKPGVVLLTGVAYTDAIQSNNFYTIGEGMAGVTITAQRSGDGAVFTTTTLDAGGYSLPLGAGTYRIYASGGGLSGTIDYGSVSIAASNVKVDFKPSMVNSATPPPGAGSQTPDFAQLVAGVLSVNGTAGSDTISLDRSGNVVTATLNGNSLSFEVASINSIQIFAQDGNDIVRIGTGVTGAYVNAGAGNDSIIGGDGNDTLTGAAGKDTISGGGGDDRINGGAHGDSLSGDDGNDRIYGNEGDDTLIGAAGVDRLWGGADNDRLFGESSNDKLYGEDGDDYLEGNGHNDYMDAGKGNDTLLAGAGTDTLFGGAGFDRAGVDSSDIIDGIELLI